MKLNITNKYLILREKQKYIKDKIYFSYRKIGYIVRNYCSKSKDASVVQTAYKKKLNIISQDCNSESIYKEGDYNRDNNWNLLPSLGSEEVILENKARQA